MRRRIAGVETEYGIACMVNGKQRLNADEIAHHFFTPVIHTYHSSNIFTKNGSRLYLDVGSHPEYATCECDSVDQLLTYIRAGDEDMNELAMLAEQGLAHSNIGGDVYIFKNNTDASGNSFGSHENYLIERTDDFFRISQALIPFLVTRQLICGAGKVLTDPSTGETTYRLSQRAEHVFDGVSSATTRSRPIINTRDEPLSDSSLYRRMHVIVGDSSMAEPTTALKLGSTLLMLEMLEKGVEVPNFYPQDPIEAIRIVSHGLDGRAEFPLKPGGTATALQVQQVFCDAATRYLVHRPADQQTSRYLWVVDLWARVLTAIESGDLSSIASDIDWVIKKTLLDRQIARHGLDLSDARCAKLDLTYHDIRPGRGIFPLMEARGLINRLTDPAEVESARSIPPSTTRANMRGRFISQCLDSETPFSADWTHIKRLSYDPCELELNDPFVPMTPEAESLISSIG